MPAPVVVRHSEPMATRLFALAVFAGLPLLAPVG
ncbi:hypothetical protein Barb6_01636 [Bacteroidales bacterium Barb6]|nr:hypothetical protein Barb6_01636 [Bacteroidales bacterium Barb6]